MQINWEMVLKFQNKNIVLEIQELKENPGICI